MVKISTDQLLQLAKYLSIIHHSAGRLRLRINPAIVKMKDEFKKEDFNIDSIKDIPKKFRGIKDVKVIPLLGSITITYDNDIFPMKIWNDLISGENVDETRVLINKLIKEIS